MANQINLQPQVLNLALYAGDGVKIRLKFTDQAGAPVDITGSVKAQIRLNRLTPDDPPITQFLVNLTDAYLGIVILSLTGDQTFDLIEDPSASRGKFVGVWDVEWDAASEEPRTVCQGSVECVADVTR